MPVIPQYDTIDLQLLINGSNDNLHTLVKQINVEYNVNKIPYSKIILVSDNHLNKTMRGSVDNFALNNDIEIKLKENKEYKTLFKGIIVHLKKSMRASGFRMELECKDAVSKLLSIQEFKEDEDFQEAFDRLTSAHSISNNLDLGALGQEQISIVDNLMPWDFIVSNLDSVGFLTTIKGGEFSAILSTDSKETTTEIQFGVDVFEMEYNIASTVSKVAIDYWSVGDQDYKREEVETEVEPSEGIEINDLRHTSFSQETINQMAQARAAKNRLSSFSGRVKTFGNLQANYGEHLTFLEAGSDLGEKAFLITSEHHIIDEEGWKTEYFFGLETNKSYAEEISITQNKTESRLGQVHSISGLHIGVVTALEGDPRNQYRIRVNIPSIVEDQPGFWARMTSLQAGNDRGAWFIPEIGDEVVLGFFNDNPDNPVVLGKLYSGTNSAPFELSDDNLIQGIVSKEGNQIIIDDEKKCILIETPSGNRINISDEDSGIILEDQNGNSITMDSSGITIESAKDLNLKGSVNTNLEGGQASLKASAVMTIEGALIQLN